MKKIICVICMIVGLSIIFYPHLQQLSNEKKQMELLKMITNDNNSKSTTIEIESVKENELLNKGSLMIQEEVGIEDIETQTVLIEQPVEREVENKKKIEVLDAVGAISIGKIDLELPLLKGATKENLSIAPSILRESAAFGTIGNISIAGHRSYTYGKQFNRLDEVDIDDTIGVRVDDKEYVYTITNKMVVEPEEVWVLEGNDQDQMITLITCTPIKVATHRLIVQGVLESITVVD